MTQGAGVHQDGVIYYAMMAYCLMPTSLNNNVYTIMALQTRSTWHTSLR
jgi:hypothetical protein